MDNRENCEVVPDPGPMGTATRPSDVRPHSGPRAALVGALLAGAVAGGLAGVAGAELARPQAATAQANSSVAPLVAAATLPVGGDGVANIYSLVSPGVVHIASQLGGGRGGIGSGFVLNKQGEILTNNHVVDGAQKVTVQLADGTETPATVLGRDPTGDLALIKVNVSADKLTPLSLGDSDTVRPGQLAVAIGNPLGLDRTVTAGVVSAVARTESAGSGPPLRGLIQTDAPINPGNSGGPLLDSQGQVIGLTTLGSQDAQSIGFAIPINAAKRYLPQLEQGAVINHAYLGLAGRDLTSDLAQSLGLSVQQGVLVAQVAPNGPAAKAGLKAASTRTSGAGGDVITAIDGKPVKGMDDLGTILDAHSPGDQVSVQLQRGGSTTSLTLTLGQWPSQ